jgi:hypothetical protein
MKYEVTITAVVTKTYIIEVASEDDVIDVATEVFSVLSDGAPEKILPRYRCH